MAIIGHVAIRLRLFPCASMTVTVIHGADKTLNQVKTSGKDNYSQADTSVPESQVVWVGASADTCFSAIVLKNSRM